MPDGYQALDPCVHCGFCLPACPTYLATGDENDSPRGRIVLMRALERGTLRPSDPILVHHLEDCLGCRGCEPACPSGVEYGRGLEAARRQLAHANGFSIALRGLLRIFATPALWRPGLTLARWFRATGLPSMLAGGSKPGFALGMLAATKPRRAFAARSTAGFTDTARLPESQSRGTVALFRGCIMETLFDHVHQATRRTLTANGFTVLDVPGQGCCGALHEHAGASEGAKMLARDNVAAFAAAVDHIAVNSAGCGAILKDYAHLVDSPAARALAGRVRDVTEILALAGPRRGAALAIDIAYDAPCHLQHAQGIREEPSAVLAAVPGLRVHHLPGADRCCGSAGLFSLLRPSMARAVLADKIASIVNATPRPAAVATGNPGCLMQIGAGLAAAGSDIGVVHPVELLDWSYDLAGYYQSESVPDGDNL